MQRHEELTQLNTNNELYAFQIRINDKLSNLVDVEIKSILKGDLGFHESSLNFRSTDFDNDLNMAINPDYVPIIIHIVGKGIAISKYEVTSHPRIIWLNLKSSLAEVYKYVKEFTKKFYNPDVFDQEGPNEFECITLYADNGPYSINESQFDKKIIPSDHEGPTLDEFMTSFYEKAIKTVNSVQRVHMRKYYNSEDTI